tara:strand:- start:697 stop:1293 length:597 start_codon:yes stop_codon:yes gene_type:complete
MGRYFFFGLIIIGIFLIINEDSGFKRDDDGIIISEGIIDSYSLRVGDCYNHLDDYQKNILLELKLQELEDEGKSLSDLSEEERLKIENYEFSEVFAKPCDSSHNYELVSSSSSLFDFDSYPDSEVLTNTAAMFCYPSLNSYLGIDDFNESKLDNFLSSRGVGFTHPTQNGWALGARLITCYIESSNTIGSFKNIYKDK